MTACATHVEVSPGRTGEFPSVRMAVLELLADAAPRPAALGAPSPEEQDFLDTLRRIVARGTGDDLMSRYRGARTDAFGWVFARYRD